MALQEFFIVISCELQQHLKKDNRGILICILIRFTFTVILFPDQLLRLNKNKLVWKKKSKPHPQKKLYFSDIHVIRTNFQCIIFSFKTFSQRSMNTNLISKFFVPRYLPIYRNGSSQWQGNCLLCFQLSFIIKLGQLSFHFLPGLLEYLSVQICCPLSIRL